MKLIRPLLLILLILVLTACKQTARPSQNPTETQESTAPVSTQIFDESQNPQTVILSAPPDNELRIRYLTEDIEFVREQLPQSHLNLFHNITEEAFNDEIDTLIARLESLSSYQVFTELNRIISAVGDAHTDINYWDGKALPLSFYLFDDGFYVINGEPGMEDYLFKKVTALNQIPIEQVQEELAKIVSRENDSWLAYNLGSYLSVPIYLEGLSLIPGGSAATFTFEDEDGSSFDGVIPIIHTSDSKGMILTYQNQVNRNGYQPGAEAYYWFEYLEDSETMYFRYNVCNEMDSLSFTTFNESLFEELGSHDAKAVFVDLRYNTGGNSEIIQPFVSSIAHYHQQYPQVPIYIGIGRQTFSSGTIAVYYLKEAVPDAILIGEPTGGSPNSFGEVQYFLLPNMALPVTYSVKYFALGNNEEDTFSPDILVSPAIEDFRENQDSVLTYINSQQ